jgi:hypothetical protein
MQISSLQGGNLELKVVESHIERTASADIKRIADNLTQGALFEFAQLHCLWILDEPT